MERIDMTNTEPNAGTPGISPEASARALDRFRHRETDIAMADVFRPARVMTVLETEDGPVMALDSCCSDFAPAQAMLGGFDSMLHPLLSPFIGYPAIAALRRNKILSNIIDMQAEDMTTFWLELSPAGEGVSAEYVKSLAEIALGKWKIDTLIREMYRDHLGWDGGCLLYIDIPEDEHRLESPLTFDTVMIRKGSIRSFRVVEAINCMPLEYNTWNPLAADYYEPQFWSILGKKVHASRFLHFSTGKLPTLMKPAYNFFGIPLPQQLLPYLLSFDEARCNVLGAINNHALLGLKTNLMRQLQEGCNDPAGLVNRVRLMQTNRSNDGIAVIDKENEDFFQITTPLTELSDLSAQQMELIAMMVRYSVTRIFGTPPRGMDASGDNYREDEAKTVAGWQKAYLHDNVVKLYALIELNEFGRVRGDIRFSWPSAIKQTEKERLDMLETRMRVDAGYLGAASPVVHAEEVRERLSADPNSGFYGIRLAPERSGGELYYGSREES